MANGLTPAQESRALARAASSILGRFTGPRRVATYTNAFTTGSTANRILRGSEIPFALPIADFLIGLRGRLVIGTANYTTGAPEAPQSLVQRIQIRGTHRKYGSITLFDAHGATAFAWGRMFQAHYPYYVDGDTYRTESGRPWPTTGIAAGATGTYDFELYYPIPTAPLLGPSPSSKRSKIPFLLRPEEWGDSLEIEITLADETGLGDTAATTTVTWTAFGSATGTPSVELFCNYALMGPFARLGEGNIVQRFERVVSAGHQTAAATALAIHDLRKEVTSNILIKSGTVTGTGITAGVTVYTTLDDDDLEDTHVLVDDKHLHQASRNSAMKAYLQAAFNAVIPEGYHLISFVDGGNPLLSLRGDLVAAGVNFQVLTNVVGAANAQQRVLQETIKGPLFTR